MSLHDCHKTENVMVDGTCLSFIERNKQGELVWKTKDLGTSVQMVLYIHSRTHGYRRIYWSTSSNTDFGYFKFVTTANNGAVAIFSAYTYKICRYCQNCTHL